MEFKRCTGGCGLSLPTSEFNNAGQYLQSRCKKCMAKHTRAWEEANPDKVKKQRAKQRRKSRLPENALKIWERLLRVKRNLSIEQYYEQLAFQNGTCALCGTPPQKIRLAVDHDHATGENRGLLCGPCNTALNRLENVADWVEKALMYLKNPPFRRSQ